MKWGSSSVLLIEELEILVTGVLVVVIAHVSLRAASRESPKRLRLALSRLLRYAGGGAAQDPRRWPSRTTGSLWGTEGTRTWSCGRRKTTESDEEKGRKLEGSPAFRANCTFRSRAGEPIALRIGSL